MKLPISALVASCNDGHLLEGCLQSLGFCDEIFGVDLESEDNTANLFSKYATRSEVFHRVPMVEQVHEHYIDKLKHDWFILIDPDERIMPGLAVSISEVLKDDLPNISIFRAPMRNYFKGKALEGTRFGGVVYARLLFRRSGIIVSSSVHKGIVVKPGYDYKKIIYNGENYDKHLWFSSWKNHINKHSRYLLGEGMARYNAGSRYVRFSEWKALAKSLYLNIRVYKAYKDGLRGLAIALFDSIYEFRAQRRLKQYEQIIRSQNRQ